MTRLNLMPIGIHLIDTLQAHRPRVPPDGADSERRNC